MAHRVGTTIGKKLVNMLGANAGERIANEVLQELGVQSLANPNHELAFGKRLVERGGLLAFIGRSIQIQAIMHGADDSAAA